MIDPVTCIEAIEAVLRDCCIEAPEPTGAYELDFVDGVTKGEYDLASAIRAIIAQFNEGPEV